MSEMSKIPKIAAVVVTYNREAALQEALPRILAEPFATVMVIDNASSDGTAQWLAGLDDPRLLVLRLPENIGGAGGFAAGLEALGPHDWYVLADDDAWPVPGALAAFAAGLADLRAAAPGPLGAVVSAVHLPTGAICEMNRPALNPWASLRTFWRALRYRRAGFHIPDHAYAGQTPLPVDTGSFVGFFLSAEGLAQIGPPDPGFFLYADDAVYALSLRAAGLSNIFAPSVGYVHNCTSLGVGNITRPLWKVYYRARNGVRLAYTAAGPLGWPFAMGWYLVAWVRLGRHYETQEKRAYYGLLARGLWDGLRGVRGRHPDYPPSK